MSKFHNIKTQYKGMEFDSGLEAQYAMLLDQLTRATDPKERVAKYEHHVPFPLTVNGVKVATYEMDFIVDFTDGRREAHEVKGAETAMWRLKAKMFRALYPEHPLVVIKKTRKGGWTMTRPKP